MLTPRDTAPSDLLATLETYSAGEVTNLMLLSLTANAAYAEELRLSGRIFGILQGGTWHYPKFQFQDSEPRPIIGKILHEFPRDPSGREIAYFFLLANSYLDDRRPLDLIGDDEQRLVSLAHRYAHPAEIF